MNIRNIMRENGQCQFGEALEILTVGSGWVEPGQSEDQELQELKVLIIMN